jgi:hypothetical protein
MQIRELSKLVTSKRLNESLAKNFGYKLKLEQFNDVQLSDVQNKLRTEMSQLEMNESFDSLHESPAYQKTRALLDVINQEVMEREEGKCGDCHKSPCACDIDESQDEEATMKKQKKNESVNQYRATAIGQRAKGFSVPQSWINGAINRIHMGESDNAELKAELSIRYDLTESQASYILAEGEEDKAEIIMATKDMVDRITGWLEDVAAMKAEQLLELMDSIRETQGSDVAQQYQDAVKPALEAIYTALETSRTGLSTGLSLVSGGEAPTMGAPAAPAGGLPSMGGDEMAGMAADMSGAVPAEETPPAPEVGREKRESIDYSRKLGMLLASKKK